MIPIKSPREIEKMRIAGRAASEILEQISAFLRPGLTTGEVDRFAAELIAATGCRSAFLNYRKFPGNICISVNDEVVHGIGSPRRIQYGDVVKLDVGVFKDGWVGDTAATVAIGVIDHETSRLLQATEDTLNAAIPLVREGRRLGEICAFIEQSIIRSGFSVVREFVGHGVGRKLHEEPQVPNYGKRTDGPKLKAGMTLAIEPMVNLGRPDVKVLNDNWTVVTTDGKPSAHYEHTVLVTKGDPEILTLRKSAVVG